MIKLLICLLGILPFVACKDETFERPLKDSSPEFYPFIIDSLNLETTFDEIKWHLYLIKCDDTPKNTDGTIIIAPPMPYGTMDLRFDSLISVRDTSRMYFTFYHNNQPVSCNVFHHMKNPPVIGMKKVKNNDTAICYLTNCIDAISEDCIYVPRKVLDTSTDRSMRPLQPDVQTFIKNNSRILNPWFYNQAVKRGLLQ